MMVFIILLQLLLMAFCGSATKDHITRSSPCTTIFTPPSTPVYGIHTLFITATTTTLQVDCQGCVLSIVNPVFDSTVSLSIIIWKSRSHLMASSLFESPQLPPFTNLQLQSILAILGRL